MPDDTELTLTKRYNLVRWLIIAAIPLIPIIGLISLPEAAPNMISTAPNGLHTASLYEIPALIDTNHRIKIRDTLADRDVLEYTTPDELPLNDTSRFIWNQSGTAVILAGENFSIDDALTPSPCVPSAYLLIDCTTTPPTIYSAASQRDTDTRALTSSLIEHLGFCSPD